MSERTRIESLVAALESFGIGVPDGGSPLFESGFPIPLVLSDGSTLFLSQSKPGMLASLDGDVVGAAVLDPLGYTRHAWGLARRLRFFRLGTTAILTEIAPLVQDACDGVSGSMYVDGHRYYGAPIDGGGAMVLCTSAFEEKTARKQSERYLRESLALKKIGRALNMNQSIVPLCYAAVHEIGSVGELAAVLLWTLNPADGSLTLTASTGANRAGTTALAKLSAKGGSSCVAELVAGNRAPFFLPNVKDQVLTSSLEGRFCYLEPGAVSAWPLVTGGNLIGVLELIGRDGDEGFQDQLELFQTVAEHLALAINSAVLFENFERLASHDPLTGLANHRAMQEFLHLRFAESQRTNAEIGAIMIDVDHFRSFNEEEGHETGDQVLKLVAETIRSIVRPYDLAARYGGEEFTVILPGTGRESTLTIAERIRKKVETSPFETRSGRERCVTVSMGCAVFPHTTSDSGALLRAADAALYDSKKGGRNRVTFYEGVFEDRGEAEMMSLEGLWKWIPNTEKTQTRTRLDRLEPLIERAALELGMSSGQQQILRALAIVGRRYVDCVGRGDLKKLRALKALGEFRVLEPMLAAIRERFDGKGPNGLAAQKIPWMVRVYTAIVALESNGPSEFSTDTGQFDPEIVAVLASLAEAA